MVAVPKPGDLRPRVYRLSGSARERGHQFGAAAAEPLRQRLEWPDARRARAKLAGAGTSGHAATTRIREFLHEHCPQLVEEMAGVGEGAGLPFEDAFFLSV